MTDLASLLTRVEGAKGPDRELDAAILCACGILQATGQAASGTRIYTRPHSTMQPDEHGNRVVRLMDDWRWPSTVFEVEPVTASIDAAVALIEKAGWSWHIGSQQSGDADASIFAPIDDMEPNAYATAPALSLCAALIRAKMETNND